MPWLALFSIPALLEALLNFLTALIKPIGSIIEGLTPLLSGIANLLVWYVKELYAGVVVILNNLHSLLLIITLVFGTAFFTVAKERADCRVEVTKQRQFDERKISSGPRGRIPRLQGSTEEEKTIPVQEPLRIPSFEEPKPSALPVEKEIKPVTKPNRRPTKIISRSHTSPAKPEQPIVLRWPGD